MMTPAFVCLVWPLCLWSANALLANTLHLGDGSIHLLRIVTFAICIALLGIFPSMSSSAFGNLLTGTVDLCDGTAPAACENALSAAATLGSYLVWEMAMNARCNTPVLKKNLDKIFG